MIPTIIMLLLRRYRKSNPQGYLLIQARLFSIARVVFFFFLAMTLAITAKSQEMKLNYIVKKGDSEVGQMNVREIVSGSKISLRLDLDVKIKLLFSFTAKGVEEAVYDKGVLTYSYFYQKLNGTEKVNKYLQYINKIYVVNNKGSQEKLSTGPIYYNMVCLYTHEPRSNTRIFSDKYQKHLVIQKLAEHHYKIEFPDGNYNEYFYENGICRKVEVNNSLFTITMELQK